MEYAGLIEMALVFCAALALGGWELWSLRRDKRRAAERETKTPNR